MSPSLDGTNRRVEPTPDLGEIWTLLHEIKTAQEVHLQQEKEFRPKLEELITLLERSKGVITFLKLLLYIGAPIVAIAAWAKDHIKL